MRYVLALDQGTTSSRSMLVDSAGKIVGIEQQEFKQIFPRSGWVEHDPEEIWLTQLSTMRKLMRNHGVSPSDLVAIGISNQRETTVVWDRSTGSAVANAIVWQDRRTAGICDELKAAGHQDMISTKTGLVIDAYFSATKIKWLLDHTEGLREMAGRGQICFGTIDSWLLYRLTDGEIHATDYSNASRTMLFNIHTLEWDEDLLKLLDIPKSILPEVKPSAGVLGRTSAEVLGEEVPIAGVAGDQQAALFGQQCVVPGMAKNTYGTGCFMLMNTGENAVKSDSGLLTTIAWGIDGKVEYALEGSVFVAGAAIQWLRDALGMIDTADESQALALSVDDNDGVYFVPAFAGLGTPYWDMHARGAILGISRGTRRGHIVRAALEAIAYRTAEVLEAMKQDGNIELHELRVDGGAAVNDFLMQFQTDILGVPVLRPIDTESTALGAAYLAGLGAGLWTREALQKNWTEQRRFEPGMTVDRRSSLMSKWKEAVQRSRGWSDQ